MEVIPLNNSDSFLLQDNSIFLRTYLYVFLRFKSLKSNLLFTIWDMFSNISSFHFYSFSVQNIKNNCDIIFVKFFPIIFFWWNIYLFSQLHQFIKGLIFVILCGYFLASSCFTMTVTAYWKHLVSLLLMIFIVAFLCFVQSVESIHDPPWFGIILWHILYNKWI